MPSDRIVVVGSGAFGLSTARVLSHRGYAVTVVDPTGPTPHSPAASRDISKVVRSEYWDDAEYTELAEAAIDQWLGFNERWGVVYHNVGVTLLTPEMTASSYEGRSYATALARGKPVERLDEGAIRRRFPMFAPGSFNEGYFNPRGGYVEALKVLYHLRDDLERAGVQWRIGAKVASLIQDGDRCRGVRLTDGSPLEGDHVLLAMGTWTGLLLPELRSRTQSTGQPEFFLAVPDIQRYSPPAFTVVMADIENTGQYMMPVHPVERVVKVGLHTTGRPMHPERDSRMVGDREVQALRAFQKKHMPELATAPIVDTRLCMYHDTQDQHFWIDRHPAIDNLTVACGGSGHAFKFLPVLGQIIGDVVEGKDHPYRRKFQWRGLVDHTMAEPAARPRLEDLQA